MHILTNYPASDPAAGGGEGAKKHEIYMATFGSHLFYDLFVQGWGWGGGGGNGPLGTPLDPLLLPFVFLKGKTSII